MDASWIAAVIIGALQPFVMETLTRGRFVGAAAARMSILISLVGGLIAVWLTGGLADVVVPAFTLLDPSPLVLFILTQTGQIMLVSRITYAIPGIGPTGSADAPQNGLVQKVARTEVVPTPAAPPASPSN